MQSSTPHPHDTPSTGKGTDLRGLLHEHGLRHTPQRAAVLKALAGQLGEPRPDHHHLTAAELHEELHNSGIDLDLATVYRTVTTLVDLGLVHASAGVDQPTQYGLASDSHHHTTCIECGKVAEISAHDLEGTIGQLARLTGYDFTATSINVPGVCPACQRTTR